MICVVSRFAKGCFPFSVCRRLFTNSVKNVTVLGIETTCDDTGVALVNAQGEILSEVLYSQQKLHLKYGGIIPPKAGDLHRENIEKAVNECISNAKIDFADVNAIAVANRPGLPLSISVGVRYARHLAREHLKPLVPIHHMEAHALLARMYYSISYPFLCLLISGGHCQLTFVKNPDDFYLLGESIDDAPGEAFDKVARRLKIRNIPKFEWLNGGTAIELAAQEAVNIDRYEFPLPLARDKDCQFSFAGLKNNAFRTIKWEEKQNDVRPDEVIPNYSDFCAGFLKAMTRHLSYRTQRAIEYCVSKKLFEDTRRNLVISGGVACNDVIFNSISKMAENYNIKTFRPLKKYCSDNGIMIAWNGIEKILHDESHLHHEIDKVVPVGTCSIGKSWIEDVRAANIKCKWYKVQMS